MIENFIQYQYGIRGFYDINRIIDQYIIDLHTANLDEKIRSRYTE